MSRTLMTGEFMRQLRVLNPRLRVCAFENSNRLAGLHYIDEHSEYFDICGVDKNWVPEYSEWDAQGHMLRSGWRRVYLMLVQLKLTTPALVMKVCPGFYLHWSQARVDEDRRFMIQGDPIKAKLDKFGMEAPVHRWRNPDTGKVEEGTVLTDDQNLEIAADIRAKDPEHVKAQSEKERWFLDTWKKRGGNLTDKPKI